MTNGKTWLVLVLISVMGGWFLISEVEQAAMGLEVRQYNIAALQTRGDSEGQSQYSEDELQNLANKVADKISQQYAVLATTSWYLFSEPPTIQIDLSVQEMIGGSVSISVSGTHAFEERAQTFSTPEDFDTETSSFAEQVARDLTTEE